MTYSLKEFNTQSDKPLVFFSSDDNPFYSDFAPYISKAWESFGFEPIHIVINEENNFCNAAVIPYGNQAQISRMLLPSLYPNRICLTADIDMLPLNAEYFLDSIKRVQDQKDLNIVSLSSDAYRNTQTMFFKRHPVCYIAGYGSTFSAVNGVKTIEDVSKVMIDWWKKGYGWDTDEMSFSMELYQAIACDKVNLVELNRGWDQYNRAIDRIDRDHWSYDSEKLNNNGYIDSHLLRPLQPYYSAIEPLFKSIGIL